jgi:hypothetical protein
LCRSGAICSPFSVDQVWTENDWQYLFYNYRLAKLQQGTGRGCEWGAKNKKGHMPEQVTFFIEFGGVADGARTHDNRNHNPGLYQLSYSHH